MFNPHARWDQPLPVQDTALDEPVEVNATFSKGQVRPEYFVWKNNHYPLKAVTYKWQENIGIERIFCFSAHDDANLYQLNLNNKFMTWRLVKICPL